jgi:hypothetical protein
VSVVPREQKKRAVKKDKRGTEREKRVRCPEESSKRDKEKYAAGNAAYFLAAKPISYLHHTVLDHIVVTEQFLYDSTLYYMEQRLLQCI